ncbi:MAG: hypothetical protein IPL11_13750 [Candidatus Accumulibacter sp.]|nr:hypothetical protein [Accumulibacter sp.]
MTKICHCSNVAILLGLAILSTVGHQLAPLLNPKTDIALPLSSCDLGQEPVRRRSPTGLESSSRSNRDRFPVLRRLKLQATRSRVAMYAGSRSISPLWT